MKPGIYENLPNEEYHASLGWSSSQLKLMALKTPLHFYDKYIAEDREQEEGGKSGPLAVGSLFHYLTLEPERDWKAEFIVHPEINRRTKDGKAEWGNLIGTAKVEHKMLVSKSELADCEKMAEETRKQPIFMQLFSGGRAEISMYVIDSESGLLLKVRPDYTHEDGILVDLKSCREADFESAGRAAFSFGYFIQAAMYLDVASMATGIDYTSFILAFMEKERPYAAAPYVMAEEDIALGRMLYRGAIKSLLTCIETQRWPGYPMTIQELTMPEWAKRKLRARGG